MTSEVTLAGVVLDNVPFDCGKPLKAYEEVLGPPSRSDGGPPAPYGHRNNVLHYYDELGILLREHHASYLIQGIDLLLEPSQWHFPTTRRFTGKLLVCDVEVHPGMRFRDFARESRVPFQPHLGHAWFVDSEKLSIQLEVYEDDQAVSTDGLISAVLVGFSDAHRPQKGRSTE